MTAICAYQPCSEPFTPVRRTQRFHTTPYRDAFWHHHRHTEPHKCPLCGALHQPDGDVVAGGEDRIELDVIEHAIQETDPSRLVVELRAIIARRRGMLRGDGDADN